MVCLLSTGPSGRALGNRTERGPRSACSLNKEGLLSTAARPADEGLLPPAGTGLGGGLTTGGRRDSLCRLAKQGSREQELHAFVLTQSCLTLRSPMDGSPPSSSVHRVSQARILEWLPLPALGDLSDPGTEPRSLASAALAGRFFATSLSWEVPRSFMRNKIIFHLYQV